MMHRIATTDPISLHEVMDLEGKPFIVEGDHYNDLTIYFENNENRQAYLDIPVECPGNDFTYNLDNSIDEGYAEG